MTELEQVTPPAGVDNFTIQNERDAAERRRTNSARERIAWLLRTSFPTGASLVLAVLVCVVAPFTLIALHIHENPLFSPLDEAAHYDYVNRIADGSIPRLGQPQLPSTLRAVACTGSALPGAVQPPCNTPSLLPSKFGGGGLSYEAQQPPAYYAITVPFRWIAVHAFGLGDLSGTRAVGALWLSAGLLMLWVTGRLLDLDPAVVGACVLLIATAPAVVYEGSIVTNTASMIFAGAFIAVASALACRRHGRWVTPVLFTVGLFAAALKETGALAAAVVSVLFAMAAYQGRPSEAHLVATVKSCIISWSRDGGALLAGGALGVVAWTLISGKLSLIDLRTLPSLGVLRGYPVGVSLIAKEALSMLTPGTGSYAPFRANGSATVAASSPLAQHLQTITATLLGYLFIAGGVAGLFVRRRRWYHWMGMLSLPALFVGGVVLGMGIWHTYNADPGLSGRYGLVLLPFLAIALVAAIRGRWLLGGVWGVGIVMFGLDIFYMLSR